MYNNNYVSSGLITGTQWDVTLNTMLSKNAVSASELTNSNSWGNYKNSSISYSGKKATAYYNGSGWWVLPAFGTTGTGTTTDYTKSGSGGTEENKCDLLTTGSSATTERYHIFDLAGNLWEWTEEDSHYVPDDNR